MKKVYYAFTALLAVSALLFFGCSKVDTEKQNDKFYGALTDLSLQVFKFNPSTKGAGNVSSYEEYVETIFNYVQKQFSSIVSASCCDGTNFYQNIDENDVLNSEAFDIIDLYGTEAFSDILFNIIFQGESYTVDDIYNNNSLLPNEKVAAVLLQCLDAEDRIITKAESSPCLEAYDRGMDNCRSLNYVRIAVSLAVGLASPTLGAVCTMATVIDNDTCTRNVEQAYRDCIDEKEEK